MSFGLRVFCVLLALAPLPQAQTAHKPNSKASEHQAPALAGELSNGIYRNPFLGFIYKVPFGWVDRTQEMQEDASDSQSADSPKSDSGKSIVLLAEFERPPEARGDTINSAIVITAERTSAFPAMKTAADYFGALNDLTTAKGFKAAGDPYAFAVGATQLVRGDFSKELGKLTMFQSSLVTMQKGYALSFTFIAGTEDDVDLLIENLNFARKPPSTARK